MFRVLESAILVYANKARESATSHEFGFGDFWRIGNGVLDKGTFAFPSLFNGCEILPPTSDKAKVFAETFPRKSKLDDQVSSVLVFTFRTNLKLDGYMIKKVRWS